ncbi:MAG: molybdopterin-guanine dinucleotide biosynthesis protein B [Candidatus Bathyarchaeia archaeon]
MTKVLAIIGSRDSGKTTVGEYLARRLAEKGFKVGAIKHVHTPDFSLDVEGKDTWRYRHAGAQVVACVAEGEITVIRAAEQDRSLSKVLSYMQADELDIVLLEGLKSESSQRTDVYKVVTAKRPEDLEETMKRLAPPILAVTGLIAKKALGRQLAGLPVVDIDTEGERLAELVQSKIRLKEAG